MFQLKNDSKRNLQNLIEIDPYKLADMIFDVNIIRDGQSIQIVNYIYIKDWDPKEIKV